MTVGRCRFGEFTIDIGRACLRRGDEEILLRPKSFAVLQYLVLHADRLVTKEELLTTLWPNLIVTDDSLTRCISEIRAALGEGAEGTVKTVPKRGYMFAEPVYQVPDDQPAGEVSAR
jgi:DNA-binding winged helix-turn-helix (wHTH) protein